MIEFTDEHEAFRAMVRDFARREPRAARRSVGKQPPSDRSRRVAANGRARPVRHRVRRESGAAAAATSPSLCIAIEELGTVSQSLGITLAAAVGLGANPILAFGTDEQKERWLPDLVAGRRARRVRPHRARRRQRRRRHAHARRTAPATSG